MTLFKYANRKMYAPCLRSYVRGSELLDTISRGHDVKVICHKTKNDITAETLLSLAMRHKHFQLTEVLNLIRGNYL